MSNAANTDSEADSGDSVGGTIIGFLSGIRGKTFLFVVFLLLFGRVLDWVGTVTGLHADTNFISLFVGMSYSLAGVIVLVALVVAIAARLQ